MMDAHFITILLSIIGGLLGLLIILLAWIGNRIHGKLDEISSALIEMEKDLREDLSSLDRRVTKVETEHLFFMTTVTATVTGRRKEDGG